MKSYSIYNDYLEITVSESGAEIISVIDRIRGIELIWNGDSRFWAEHSPILFPAVGDWKDNVYVYKDVKYEMPVHGFARFQRFEIECTENKIICILRANQRTWRYYPFDFRLKITYHLCKNTIYVKQEVLNLSSEKMPYSIGEHIGFNVPLFGDETYQDYYLKFNREETAKRYPLVDGRVIGKPVACLDGTKYIYLHSNMFKDGAWNFKGLRSDEVTLSSKKSQYKIKIRFKNFLYFSIWSIPGAPFLCIEPSKGIAASQEEGHNPFSKKGIRILEANQSEETKYAILVEGKNNDKSS